MKVRCLREDCGYEGDVDTFDTCLIPYHDMICPKCGTSKLDTSEVNAEMDDYAFGDDNFLRVSRKVLG